MKEDTKANWQIHEIDNFYKMKREDIEKYAECATLAYKNYPLFKYLINGKYNHKVIKTIISASIYAMKNQTVSFSDSAEANAVAIFVPPKYKGSNFLAFLIGGGFKLIFMENPTVFLRLLTYENHSMRLKKKHTNHESWYLYNVTVKPEYQNCGESSKLLKPMFEYLDRIGQDCYVETHEEKNVKLYEHFKFELIEVSNIPKTNIKQYSMVRKAQPYKEENDL